MLKQADMLHSWKIMGWESSLLIVSHVMCDRSTNILNLLIISIPKTRESTDLERCFVVFVDLILHMFAYKTN